MTITDEELEALEGGEPKINAAIRDITARLHRHVAEMAEIAGVPRPDISAWLGELPTGCPVFCTLRAQAPLDHLSALLYAPLGLPEGMWSDLVSEGFSFWRPIAVSVRGEDLASEDALQVRAYMNALADSVAAVACSHGHDVRVVPGGATYSKNILFK